MSNYTNAQLLVHVSCGEDPDHIISNCEAMDDPCFSIFVERALDPNYPLNLTTAQLCQLLGDPSVSELVRTSAADN